MGGPVLLWLLLLACTSTDPDDDKADTVDETDRAEVAGGDPYVPSTEDSDDTDPLGGGGNDPNDQDGDGFSKATDCDDNDPTVYPDAVERCDGVDNDCDDDIDEDLDDDWILVTLDDNQGKIRRIDVATGAVTVVADVEDVPGGLNSMDVRDDGFAVAHSNRKEMHQLDVCQGDITSIGPTTVADMGGVTFTRRGQMLGVVGADDSMARIDTMTGKATLVGALGFDIGSNGVAHDCATDTMFVLASNGNVFDYLVEVLMSGIRP